MTADNERPYVDPAITPGDQGTKPWAEGEPPDPRADEESPADAFTDGNSAGIDEGSAHAGADDQASDDRAS